MLNSSVFSFSMLISMLMSMLISLLISMLISMLISVLNSNVFSMLISMLNSSVFSIDRRRIFPRTAESVELPGVHGSGEKRGLCGISQDFVGSQDPHFHRNRQRKPDSGNFMDSAEFPPKPENFRSGAFHHVPLWSEANSRKLAEFAPKAVDFLS